MDWLPISMQTLLSRLTTPLVALLAVALCAIGLCAVGSGQAHAAGRYVAFGDSGTTGSGLGATTGLRPLCWQTQNSYPVHIASSPLGFTDFATAACSSAWVNDLTTEQELYNPSTMAFEAPAPPQFDTLNGTETLITISIGDNDSGYREIVNNCLNKPTPSTVCKDETHFNNFVLRANTLLSDPLGDAIDEAHRRSPNAEIWVIGYPRLIPEDVSSCPGRVDISEADAPIVNDWQKAVNNTSKATAESRGAHYLDVFSKSDGHDSCQPSASDRWTNPKQSATPSGGWSHHPTVAGQLAVANLFINAYNSIGQTLDIALGSNKVRAVNSSLAPITTVAPAKNGAALAVTLVRSATVVFRIDRAKPGRIKSGKCRKLSKRARKGRKACTRYISVRSTVALALPGGESHLYFTGRAAGKRLSAGKYRLRAVSGSLSARTPVFSLSR